MTIYFRAPAVQSPTGGVTAYFALAQLLRSMGQQAVVVSDPGLETWFLPPDIESDWQQVGSVGMERGDVLVTPEWWSSFAAEAGQARIVPYCQGAFDVQFAGYCLAISRFTRQWALARGGAPVVLVERILTPFWQAPPGSTRRNGVLVVPGPAKNAGKNLAEIAHELRNRGVQVTVAQPTMKPDELRDLLWSHEVYLGLSYPEGLDMVCQEAMACRCAVVAYSGGGRSDYLWHEQTGLAVQDGNWSGIVKETLRMLNNDAFSRRLVDSAETAINRYRTNGKAQAARFLEWL